MAAKLAEKCTIMLDVGQGMMSRVSLLSRNLGSPGGRPHSLSNTEWAKLRKTLEKKFPEVNHADLSTQPGFETFQSAAGRIIDELGKFMYKLDKDLCEQFSLVGTPHDPIPPPAPPPSMWIRSVAPASF